MVALKTMAIQINIRVAKRHLPKLLKLLSAGEVFAISKGGKPIACLEPISPNEALGHQLDNS
jgi:antitoxin (DNA-binding transcriptional repressor) of toxin-antitoxin stability system